MAMYSASVEDCAVTFCLPDFQVIAPSAARKTYPVVDFPSSQSAYAASPNPLKVTILSGSALYVIPYVHVPDKYLRIRFTAITCYILGFAMYDANRFTAKAISGRVEIAIY